MSDSKAALVDPAADDVNAREPTVVAVPIDALPEGVAAGQWCDLTAGVRYRTASFPAGAVVVLEIDPAAIRQEIMRLRAASR